MQRCSTLGVSLLDPDTHKNLNVVELVFECVTPKYKDNFVFVDTGGEGPGSSIVSSHEVD
jgi:hypothetical protein